MNRLKLFILTTLLVVMSILPCGIGHAAPVPPGSYVVDSTGYYVPDYFATPNWANSPPLTKFVDRFRRLWGATTPNNLGQCIPVAVADTTHLSGIRLLRDRTGAVSRA